MAAVAIVETIYGKYHNFDVVKDADYVFRSVKFYVRKDGRPFKGPYASLSDAVAAAVDEG